MNVIYVDDEPSAIRKFQLTADQIPGILCLNTFLRSEEALLYARAHRVDAAFLDIEMPGMGGVELARQLHVIDPSTRVVFVTAYDNHALEAFRVDALGYLLKPYTREKLENEIKKARRMHGVPQKQVYIQTMPRFEVCVDGEPLRMPGPKPRELLALMVDRNGRAVSVGEAIACLWEDRPDDSNTKTLYRMTFKRLRETLEAAGIDFILSSDSAQRCVRSDAFSCDYYDLLRGSPRAKKQFTGQYMSEYEWAEETCARIAALCGGQP